MKDEWRRMTTKEAAARQRGDEKSQQKWIKWFSNWNATHSHPRYIILHTSTFTCMYRISWCDVMTVCRIIIMRSVHKLSFYLTYFVFSLRNIFFAVQNTLCCRRSSDESQAQLKGAQKMPHVAWTDYYAVVMNPASCRSLLLFWLLGNYFSEI